jgi:hypothetical protein
LPSLALVVLTKMGGEVARAVNNLYDFDPVRNRLVENDQLPHGKETHLRREFRPPLAKFGLAGAAEASHPDAIQSFVSHFDRSCLDQMLPDTAHVIKRLRQEKKHSDPPL